MRAMLSRFVSDESGATAIEYALIGSLVSIAIVAGATVLGTKLNAMFGAVADKIK